MKIAILAPSPVPFVIGGAEKLWWGLVNALNAKPGVQADLIKIPSPERNFRELLRSYQAFSKLDLGHFDAVITTKYPAWMVSHPNHFVYLQHRLRGLYDTYHFSGQPTAIPKELGQRPELTNVIAILGQPATRQRMASLFEELGSLESKLGIEFETVFRFPGPLTRAVVHWLDSVGLHIKSVREFSAISETVRLRDDYFPAGANVRVIHHPSDLRGFNATQAKQVFTVSRLDGAKRIDLLIDAYRQTQTDVPFVIAGSGPDEERLRHLASTDHRIHFTGRLTDAEIIDNYSKSLFVPFVPYDEDYGLITVEAMQAGRAVLTTTDAGGVNEFVENGVSGYSVAPDAGELAAAMQKLLDHPEITLKMGESARRKVAHVNWANTAGALLELIQHSDQSRRRGRSHAHGAAQGQVRVDKGRRKVLVVSPFRITPAGSGGQNRVYYLYLAMSQYLDITILSLDSPESVRSYFEINAHFREVSIPLDEAGKKHLHNVDGLIRVDCGDVAMIDWIPKHEEFIRELKSLANQSEWVVASHPYLYRAIEKVYRGKLVYDSHNVEYDMKASVLGPAINGETCDKNPAGMQIASEFLQSTFHLEQDLIKASQLVVACSQQDLDRLAALYGKTSGTTVVAPNGVHLSEIDYLDLKTKRSWQKRLGIPVQGELLFFAGSWHGPNILAMRRMLELARQIPDLPIAIMGSVCLHPEFGQVPANVFKLGQLSNSEKRVVLRAVTILVNPMEAGSGTNLKMLEYAACGGSLLTTEFGNRGLNFEPDTEIFVASADSLANGVRGILQAGETKRDQMALSARKRVEAFYDWAVCADQFSSHLRWK